MARSALAFWIGMGIALAAARSAQASEAEYSLRIRGREFVPAEVHVPAGVKFRLVIENLEDRQEEFDSHALNREKHIAPRGKVTLFLGPLPPGRYPFEGESGADPATAAHGALVVR